MELITGATGFIGGSLALRLLRRGRKVRALCRPESRAKLDPRIVAEAEVALGDLRDPESLVRAARGTTAVYHCAGHVSDWGAASQFRAANVEGTRNLLDASMAAGIERFVHLSSIAVFGVPSPAFFDDATPYGDGADLYSRTKIEGEKLALAYHRDRGLPVTVLRPAVVYGPHSTWVEEPIRMMREKKFFLIGGGEGTCHPCAIENLLDAIELVSRRSEAIGQAYCVSDDEAIPFREFFGALATIAELPLPRRSIPLVAARAMATALETAARLRPSGSRPILTQAAIAMVCTRSRMSIHKIRNELQYTPRLDFRSAMQALHAHYNQGLNNPDSRSIRYSSPSPFVATKS